MGIAFAGVGIGSISLLPAVALLIEAAGWRSACLALGVLVLVVLAPINLVLRKRPEDLGLAPDGDRGVAAAAVDAANIVDAAWASIDLDACPRRAHGPLLVDRAWLFLRALRLVCGAGPPDQIPA